MTTRLVIIPCAARKLDHPAPAGDLYIGTYHRMCRTAADAITRDSGTVLILSDLYGLVPTTQVLQPYDMRMGDPHSVDAARLREQARALDVDRAEDVTVLAGRAYADLCRSVWPHAVAPLTGGIGYQRATLATIRARGWCAHPACITARCSDGRPCCPARSCPCPRARTCPTEPAAHPDDHTTVMLCNTHRAEFLPA